MRSALLVLTLCVAGCGDDVLDVDDAVRIEQGVYGRTMYLGDVCNEPEDCLPQPTRVELEVQPRKPGAERPRVISDERTGFYEIELPAGEYQICANAHCTGTFTIGAGTKVRRDYTIGFASYWCESDCGAGD